MVLQIFTSIIQGIGLTLWITFASLVIGGVVALPIAAARSAKFRPLRAVASCYTNLVRVIPPITWLFLIFFGLPQFALRLNSIDAAIVGFSVIASAFMAEIYRSGLLSIAKGQFEAATALGMSPWSTARHIITPQAYRVTVAPIATYSIGLLKDSALASAIGVHEITYFAQQSAKQYHQGLLSFAIAGVLYICISLIIAVISRRTDARLKLKLGVAQ